MKKESIHVSGGGIGFGGLLTIVFIVLKLCNVINWSWMWVFAPLWIPVLLLVVIFALVIIVSIVRTTKRR